MSYYVIGDEDTVLGFSLVGVPGSVVDTAEEAREAFIEAVKAQTAKIVVLTEKVGEMIRREVQQQVFRMSFPLVVEIPDRNGPLPGKKPISQMITEAIGVKI
jgi:V/A-type H+/Na+-transporting ATPase subunit F